MGYTRYDFDSAISETAPLLYWRGKLLPPIMGGAPDDPPAGDGGADGTPPDAPPGDGTPPDTGDGKGKDGKTFTQQELNAIVTREADKAKRGLLAPKELGFDSAKEMKDWIESQKTKDEAAKTQEDKDREQAIEDAKRDAETRVLGVANERLRKAEFLSSAVDHKLRREARADAYLLAPTLEAWESVEVDDNGNVSGFDDAFFEELKEKKPFLFEPEGDGSLGDIGAGRSGGKDSNEAKLAALKQHYPILDR